LTGSQNDDGRSEERPTQKGFHPSTVVITRQGSPQTSPRAFSADRWVGRRKSEGRQGVMHPLPMDSDRPPLQGPGSGGPQTSTARQARSGVSDRMAAYGRARRPRRRPLHRSVVVRRSQAPVPAAGAADGEDEPVAVADVTAAVRTAGPERPYERKHHDEHDDGQAEKKLHTTQGLTPLQGALYGSQGAALPSMETAPLARDMSFGSRAPENTSWKPYLRVAVARPLAGQHAPPPCRGRRCESAQSACKPFCGPPRPRTDRW
jgi:hypothetical protein